MRGFRLVPQETWMTHTLLSILNIFLFLWQLGQKSSHFTTCQSTSEKCYVPDGLSTIFLIKDIISGYAFKKDICVKNVVLPVMQSGLRHQPSRLAALPTICLRVTWSIWSCSWANIYITRNRAGWLQIVNSYSWRCKYKTAFWK